MEITTDQLLAEAGQMALQLRLVERENARLEAENARLEAQLDTPAPGDSNPT